MIKLYGFGPAFGLIDPSPFVTKVHLFMTIHNIEFETVCDSALLHKAPKRKFPVINDNGTVVADSMFILNYLSTKHDLDMDAWLSEKQRASAHLIGKSLEENLYWCLVHSRWINDDTWPTIKDAFFGEMPFPLNKIIPLVARKGTQKRINGHGMGSHSNEEILAITEQTLKSVSALLGNKPYLFGDKISSLDLIAFAQIGSFTLSSIDNQASRIAKNYSNLVRFTHRIQDTYYPNNTLN